MLYGIAQKDQMGALRAHRLPSRPTCAHTWLTPIPHATQASTRRSKSASIVRLRPRPTSAAPAIPCTLAPLLTVPTCVRRHVALRRVAEHAHPAAPDAALHGTPPPSLNPHALPCCAQHALTFSPMSRRHSRRSRSSRAPHCALNALAYPPRLAPTYASSLPAQVQGGRPRGRGALRGGRGRLRGARVPRLRRVHVGCAPSHCPPRRRRPSPGAHRPRTHAQSPSRSRTTRTRCRCSRARRRLASST